MGGLVWPYLHGHAVLAEQAVPVAEIDAAIIAQAIKDCEEDIADADNDMSRDKARARLEQLRTLKSALGH
jgi:F-type H+-transporting ATPase subunit epsilon